MPDESTVREWAIKDVGGFYPQYAHARDIGLDAMADRLLEVAETPVEATKTKEGPLGIEVTTGDAVDRSRLHVDTLKWYLCQLAPKKYGERSTVDLTVNEKKAALFDEALKRLESPDDNSNA